MNKALWVAIGKTDSSSQKISFLSMPPSCLTPNAWVGLMSFLCEVTLGAWLDSWEWIRRMDVAVIASGCIMKK